MRFAFKDPWSGKWALLAGLLWLSGVKAQAEAGSCWVSLGVYATEAAAKRQLETLAPQIGLELGLNSFIRDDRRLYRVVGGPFADRADALPVLATIRAKVSDAFVLQESSMVAAASMAESLPSVGENRLAQLEQKGQLEQNQEALPPTRFEPIADLPEINGPAGSLSTEDLPRDEEAGASLRAYQQHNEGIFAAPPGYQLHRLHRRDAANYDESADE